MSLISMLNKYVFGVGVPIFLLLLGAFYCFKLRFFHFLHPIKVAKALFCKETGASSLKALALALAGTLGVGNMVGVASAIVLGGFGAVFWMWVSAFLAMILKYAEIVLAMRYRRFDANGRPYGSAMYYIEECFGKKRVGRVVAAVFAVFCLLNSISMGSMIQVNAASSAIESVFGVPAVAVGALISVIALWSMLKGARGIMSVTEKLVPFMTLGFVILSVAVIAVYPRDAARAFVLIFENAFSFESVGGGVLGFIFSRSLRFGAMRGILSNEAGCGTAPTAHASCECSEPARQGVFGIFEVFVDTILLCTLTALVIIIGYGGELPAGDSYMEITLGAYSSLLGNAAGYFIAFSVLLFGLATVLCWGYYGVSSAEYLAGNGKRSRAFIFVYAASVVLGSVLASDVIWESADLAIGVMSVINLTALFIMSDEVKRETVAYFD